ncbi:MAG: lipase family protein [Rhizobiales bacterium]|nr:lipase family protein [Hyphomicrobiales bacterium]NRB15797.1 lipase family protein [Hyphomicrobiales bacterium]
MGKHKQFGKLTLAAIGCLALVGCVTTFMPSNSKIADSEPAKSSFPYNPLVYHLDLAILAYQIYGQSLVWPFDPYYEERSNGDNDRRKMMAKVKTWAGKQGVAQVAKKPGLNSYRGPGQLNGFANNGSHDPIIYNYNLIDPWNQAITNADGKWIEYLTPRQITANIKDTRVCYRPVGAPIGAAATAKIKRQHSNMSPNAKGYLLAFEGATGDKGEKAQPASQSLVGFILTREKADGGYDIHISFRGSRSGSGGRAAFEAFNTSNARGNPDWITDLGYNRLTASEGGAYVSSVGEVHRGFTKSMHSIMPTLMHCLAQVPGLKGGVKPDNIYVTGHSLGGALAQHFVSTILVGNQYGPDATGAKLPTALRAWPWKNIKLITFSAPRVGNETFAKHLTVDKLQSEFFTSPFSPTDQNAITVTNQQIIPRLMDKNRPVAFRVLNSKDPITTEKGAGGKHVGKTVYVNPTDSWHTGGLPDVSAHEQNTVRDFMLGSLNDNKIPKVAIRYVPMKGYNPEFDETQKGSVAEMQKLAAATKAYYRIRKIWFDDALFDKNFKLRQEIRNMP